MASFIKKKSWKIVAVEVSYQVPIHSLNLDLRSY